MANMHKGIVLPVTVVEGNITITDTFSVKGDEQKATYSNPVKEGEAVAIIGDLQVEKADGSNGTVIGFVDDHPEPDVDPVKNYTKAEAIAAEMLRQCGVATNFTDVREVPAKAGEGIAAGDYVEIGADGQKFEKASDVTPIICLAGQNSENIITIGR